VEKTLHLIRLETDGLPSEKEWYTVKDLIDTALFRRKNLMAQRHIELNIPKELPLLFVDGREIEITIINLLENAMKYSNDASPIILNVENKENKIVFHVTDKGIGISTDEQENIFDRFFRGKRGKGQVGGTGLGLAICKRIVTAHEGEIWVESVPGEGSKFSFSLPLDTPIPI
jgi:two-component system sensor histidine kinase KdpD